MGNEDMQDVVVIAEEVTEETFEELTNGKGDDE